MKYALLVSIFIFISTALSAQKDTAYIYTFGGEKDEQGRDIELTADSGFIMVGSTSSFGAGNSDIYLVKVDSNINHQWSAAIGHQYTEFGHSVKQTADKGYIICGYTNSIGAGNYDAYLVKTDSVGKLEWEQTYGGFGWDFAYDVEITPDGGYLLVGETHSFGAGNADAYLIKTDKDGILEWEKTMGGAGTDIAHALISTKDGNYAFCGENASKNPENKGDAWLVKFDGNGDTLFSNIQVDDGYTSNYNLIEKSIGGYVTTGFSTKFNSGIKDLNTIGYTSAGGFDWEQGHGGIFIGNDNKDDQGNSLVEVSNNEFWTTGSTKSFGNTGTNELYFMKFAGIDGIYLNGTTYGNDYEDIGYDIIWFGLESFYLFGQTNSYISRSSSFLLIHFEEFQRTYPEIQINYNDSSLKEAPESVSEESSEELINLFPNPVNSILYISFYEGALINEFKCFDLSGRPVKIIQNQRSFDVSGLEHGMYILSVQVDGKVETFRFVKK